MPHPHLLDAADRRALGLVALIVLLATVGLVWASALAGFAIRVFLFAAFGGL